MDPNLFVLLAEKYVNGTATADEREVVEGHWSILSDRPIKELTPAAIAKIGIEIRENVLKQIGVRRIPVYRRTWVRCAAAAVVLFAIATIWLLTDKQETPAVMAYKGDVAAPVINKATLTLANGKQIVLDSTQNGSLANLGALNANKTEEGLSYKNQSTAIEYHTLTNPKGSKPVELTLADGTKAWLNAASSITFPTAFTGTIREVTMTGEVYFEVVHNNKQPFKVHAANQVIEDLGTTFNVNAYTDEPGIKTTLVEGSVKINNAVLKPGQQYSNGKIAQANIEQALAWKNGLFSFDNADIYTVMRELSRWYNVDIKFEGKIDTIPFQGEIGRSLTLAQILKNLDQMHVHFRIEEDKRIVILP